MQKTRPINEKVKKATESNVFAVLKDVKTGIEEKIILDKSKEA